MICFTTKCQAEERATAGACGERRIDQFMVVYSGMMERKKRCRRMWHHHARGSQDVGIFLSNRNPLGGSGQGTNTIGFSFCLVLIVKNSLGRRAQELVSRT